MKSLKMQKADILLLLLITISLARASDDATRARDLISKNSWGVLTTLDLEGIPFGNVMSYTAIDGVPYFYLALTKDPTGFYALKYPKASFATSPYITNPMYNGPVCKAITLNGVLTLVEKYNRKEAAKVKDIFLKGHPQFTELPAKLVPDFKIFKLDIEGIVLVNDCAPPVEISVENYLDVV